MPPLAPPLSHKYIVSSADPDTAPESLGQQVSPTFQRWCHRLHLVSYVNSLLMPLCTQRQVRLSSIEPYSRPICELITCEPTSKRSDGSPMVELEAMILLQRTPSIFATHPNCRTARRQCIAVSFVTTALQKTTHIEHVGPLEVTKLSIPAKYLRPPPSY